VESLARLVERAGIDPRVALGIAATLVALSAAAVASRIVRRRSQGALERAAARRRLARPDPAALEAEAATAERAGDLQRAIRLRFLAGLLRLDEVEAITWRPSVTTSEVAARLRSPDFDQVAASFDEVVYGGRRAHADDAAKARTTWPRVLERAARR
jgi:hypothetical protein